MWLEYMPDSWENVSMQDLMSDYVGALLGGMPKDFSYVDGVYPKELLDLSQLTGPSLTMFEGGKDGMCVSDDITADKTYDYACADHLWF